ncbi:MAG: hypothetical protein IKV16_05555 [Clostridia bacterium]|nr:hypothetical protein [Clostridia bacterium]
MNTVKFDKKNTLVVAHRGLSGIETENTNAAFVAAGNRSYYGIETDIHRTLDGKFVVCHDDSLKRVGGENILVEEVTLDTLLNFVLFDKDGTKNRADIRPTTLENYISICKKYEKHSVLELKSDFTEEEIVKIVEIIKDLGHLESVTFISFCYDNLVRLRKILPTQSAQFLFSEINEENVNKAKAQNLDVDVRYTSLTEENVKMLHDLGMVINCWTVDKKEDAERLAAWGIEYITTNILE